VAPAIKRGTRLALQLIRRLPAVLVRPRAGQHRSKQQRGKHHRGAADHPTPSTHQPAPHLRHAFDAVRPPDALDP